MLNIKLTVQFTVYAKFSLIVLNFIKYFLKLSKFSLKTFKIFNKFFEISSNFSQNTITFLIYLKYTYVIHFHKNLKINKIFSKYT